jgi:hypothetical protein
MKIPLSPPLKRKIITPPFEKERRNTSPFGKACLPVGRGD